MDRDGWHLPSGIVIGCFIVLVAAFAFAQNQPRTGTADIPFDFYIAGAKMPAGQYTLNIIAPTYVLLRNKNGSVQQDLYFLQSALAGKNVPTQIVFALRDGKYYFAEVWSSYGKAQLTSFTANPGDQTKTVPLRTQEKTVAKPS
jgi:hypothetical protein